VSARRPEILAPAGDHQSLDAALAAGADAVYFGLDEGFNARARATNFSTANLAETVARVHRAGARAYVTLNTLVFESELAHVEAVLRSVAAAGVDALIIQDPAVARLARAICPSLELHASTQMTISSGEAAGFAEDLGCTRVVVPRELSVQEIARFAAASPVELEVFIHGALCMSWSGQCLTSEAWGGRSANRGQCAQSCRMPYDLVVDDETRDLGDVRYLLSPKDLAGFRAVEALVEAGVASLKIEGRLKGPAYVQSAVEGYRRWVAAVDRGVTPADEAALADDLGRMTLTYSRGFSDGFLAGSDHQTLVEGRFPKHRGALLGRVASVEDGAVVVRAAPDGRPRTGGLALGAGRTDPVGVVAAPLPALGGATDAATGAAAAPVTPRAGMGVVFDAGVPESPDEAGGPIFAVEPLERGGYRLGFGRPGPDLRRVSVGDRVWVTSDPALTRAAEKQAARAPEGRVPVRMVCVGRADAALRVRAEAVGASVEVETDVPLAAARGAGLDAALLRDKLGALGGTPLRLEAIDVDGLAPGLHVPVSALKRARRAIVEALLPAVERGPRRETAADPVLETLRASDAARHPPSAAAAPRLVPLCRTQEQLEAVIALGFDEVELDFMEFYGLGRAVERARGAGLRVTIATVRVQKPGEEGYDRRIARLAPDAVLIRHWGALMSFARGEARGPVVHGDFSLNVTNSLTFHHLRGLGLDTITVAHDLDRRQLAALLDHVPASQVAVTVHHHIPTFHTEHCVYAHTLSNGRDYRTCGRPCEQHEVSLRDHTGRAHPVLVDVGCRNTVFNAEAQSAASLAPSLIERGVRRLRAEFVRESAEETTRVLAAWRALLVGEITPDDAIGRIGVHEQFGVTAGTMRILG
jgi:putative protease